MSFAHNKDIISFMMEEGAKAYPNEACGFIIAKGKKSVPVLCTNISSSPKNQFLVSLDEKDAISKEGEIIAVWHTHCNVPPTPSDADKANCEAMSVPYLIMSVYRNEEGKFDYSELQLLEPSGFEMPYLERPYVFGVFDCYSLGRDYYKREFGIQLGDYPRIHNFWSNGFNFFGENWEKEGFVRVDDSEYKVGDVFLLQMSTSEYPDHVGIYVGNEMMLHHQINRLSRRDIYGGHWYKHTVAHLRHRRFVNAD